MVMMPHDGIHTIAMNDILMIGKREKLSLCASPMRCTKFFVVMFLITLFSVATRAQSQTIKLHKGTYTVASLFKEIEKQTGYSVDYSAGEVNISATYPSKGEHITLSTLLDRIVGSSRMEYKFVGRHILLSKRSAQTAKVSPTPTARTVTGIVTDETGEPLIGAGVTLEGTHRGTVTDASGHFTITVTDGHPLSFTYVGMTAQRLFLGKRTRLRVMLREDDSLMREVVVTGMNTVDRRLFTGSTTKLLGEDIKMDGVDDVSRFLEGRAAGVSVQNVSGTFGSAPKIRIRGATSILGSSKPLWVVDGVLMDDVTEVGPDELASGDVVTLLSSAVAGLNAEDVENIQILKDGSATSIYGARAMPGVIVVTTKKGHAGRRRIRYTGELTMRLKPSCSHFDMMNSQEQMAVYKEMQQKGWLTASDVLQSSDSGVYGRMYKLINTYDESTQSYALENTASAMNAYLREAEYRNTDWFDELFDTSIKQSHTLSLSLGTDDVSVYASVSALSDPGWYKDSNVHRYTAHLNTSFDLSNKLSLGFISSTSYRKQTTPGTLNRSVDALYGDVKRDFDINPYLYALEASRTLDPTVSYTRNYADFNILHELDNNYIHFDIVDLKFQGFLKYKPAKDWEIDLLAAAKYSNTTQEHLTKDESNQALAYRAMGTAAIRESNPWLYNDPDSPYSLPVSVLPEGGIYQKTDYKMNAYDLRASATWRHLFGDRHLVSVFAGVELNSARRNRTYFNGWGMQYSSGEIPFYTYQFFKKSIEEGTDYYSLTNTRTRSSAYFANATYSWKGRYIFNGTYRYEGTNRLGKSNKARWLPTWNLSGAWNVHEEPFFPSLVLPLSRLTLRMSYSLTADPGPASLTNSSVLLKSYKPFRSSSELQETGLLITDLANDDLTYEKKHEWNIGTDIGLLANRITLTADWYRRNNYDLIGIVQTEGVGGQINKLANVASMNSHGFELSIATQNIRHNDFAWDTQFIFSRAVTKVKKLEASSQVISAVEGTGYASAGHPVRSLYSFRYKGLNGEGLPIVVNQDGTSTSDGSSIHFQSSSLDNLVYEGPTDPTMSASLSNIFRYAGWSLSVFVTGSFGNVIRLYPSFNSCYSDLTAMPKVFKNRWVLSGDEAVTSIPTIVTRHQYEQDKYLKSLYNAYNYSTDRVAKGDFVRMKEIALSYDFPRRLTRTLGVGGLSMKLQATNLFLFYADSKLDGMDPEFFLSGGVAAPCPRQFTFTLRLDL
jgi:TonB-linked SusC/RagA family outer membrane protein